MKGEVLRILKENRPGFVSGESICRQLGVSRTAVWKHIRALKEAGYDIEAQPHAGYRLVKVPDRLYPEEISAGLSTTLVGRRIYYHESLASTNRRARELANHGVPDGTVVVAEEQTGGRGRLGRGWFSPYGQGIWCSVILRPPVNPADAPPITMLAAVAAAGALNRTVNLKAGIKWPNDLLVNGKKICGILTELSAEMERVGYLIIGLGINLNQENFPAELRATATSVRVETGQVASRVAVLQCLLTELEHWYLLWLQAGFAPVLARWKELSLTLCRPVRVSTLRESWTGVAEDVDENGALLLRLPSGQLQKIVSGEVSLRPQ